MALGDKVILRRGNSFNVDSFGMVPLLGIVTNENVGPPATADVVWQNGKGTDAIDQSVLDKVFDAPDELSAFAFKTLKLVGKFVQLNVWPALSVSPALEGSLPKSPAAAGIVKQTFGVGAYDAADPAAAIVILSVHDGRAHMGIQTDADPLADGTLADNPGRRAVRANH